MIHVDSIKDGITRFVKRYVNENNLNIVNIIKTNPLRFVSHAVRVYELTWGRFNRSGAVAEPQKYKLIVESLMSIGEKQDSRGYYGLFNGSSCNIAEICEKIPTKQNK